MHYSFIINPTAHSGQAAKMWARLKTYLDTNNIDYHNEMTREPGQATELAQRISMAAPQNEVIIAVGGDGTIDEVVSGLYDPTHPRNANEVPVAAIPVGWSNNFASAYGISQDPILAFQQIQNAQRTRTIYIGHYHEAIKDEDGYFLSTWGLGFDAALLSRRNNKKKGHRKMGVLAFLRNAGAVLYNQQPYSLMVQDKHSHTLYANTYISICFNHLLRGNAQLTHHTLYDHNLHLLIVERHNWLITLWTLCQLLTGKITKSRWANYIQAPTFHYTTTSLEFVQKDGIELGNRFVDVSIDSIACHFHQKSNFERS